MLRKENSRSILQVLLFSGLGLFLIWWTYRKDDPLKLWDSIMRLHYIYYLPVLFWTLLCHYLRTKRWQLLLEAGTKIRVPFFPAYHAIMAGYFVNFPTGKLGEIFRCYALRRMAGVPTDRALGSVVVERVIDVCCLLALLLLCGLLYSERLLDLARTEMFIPLRSLLSANYRVLFVLAASVLLMLFVLLMLYLFRKKAEKILSALDGFKAGLLSITKLEKRSAFLLYTAGIWLMYLLMTYTWFFAMKETFGLSPLAALLVIVLGGIGRSLPLPGHGAGPYHYFATKALILAGVAVASAGVLPIVIHAGQTIFYLIGGAIILLVFSLKKPVPLQELV